MQIFSPKQATQDSFSLEPRDLVVVGTDGLFDNLTDEMILTELTPLQVTTSGELSFRNNALFFHYRNFCPLQNCNLKEASDNLLDWCALRLVECARDAAENPNFVSPFASEARQYGLNIAGLFIRRFFAPVFPRWTLSSNLMHNLSDDNSLWV